MRPSISFVNSTGESFRFRKSFPISSMQAKAMSLSIMKVQPLEDLFAVSQIPERSNVRNDKCHTKLVLRPYLRDVDPPVFKREPAAAPVVTRLHDLVLQRFVREVVADPASKIQTLSILAAVARKGANLVRKRLLESAFLVCWDASCRRRQTCYITERRIVVEAEICHRGEKLPVRLRFDQRANRHQPLILRIVLENLLQIVKAARSNLEIAEDGRPASWPESKRKRRNRIQRLENVPLPVDDGPAKRRIEIVLFRNAPRNQLLRLIVAGL